MINNYGLHNLSGVNEKIFKNIKSKNIITNGDYCKLFEKKISQVVNSKYSVVCNNGTSAIMMSILALNLKNLVVIIPNINFVASANIISLLKGKIILCDVNKETGMVDLNSLTDVISNCKKNNIKPNLFIPIHYAGDVLDLKEIEKICSKNKINIIEDGCHSFGSFKILSNKKFFVGSCKFSKMTTFSFHAVKNITTIEGGAITTNDKKIYEKLLLLRSHSLKKTFIQDPYVMKFPTLNFRMPEICALIGLEQLKQIKKFKIHRNKLNKFYLSRLKKLEKYLKPLNYVDNNIFWHLFVVKLLQYDQKKKLMNFLKINKIGSQIHYKPIYKHLSLKKYILINLCKNSDFFYRRQLTLPLHTLMNSKNINYIVKKLKLFFD